MIKTRLIEDTAEIISGPRSVSGLDFDQHVAIFNLERIDGDFRIRIVRGLAGFRIPLPAVPRADYLAVLDHAFAERAAAVQADIVHGAVGAVYVGDADGLVAAGEFFDRVGGGKVGLGGEFDEGRHRLCSWREAEPCSAGQPRAAVPT